MKKEDRGPQVVKPPGASVPMPVGKDSDLVQIAEKCLETVALDQYTGRNPDYQGKTRLEVAVLSLAEDSAVDSDARKEFLDRIIGKPRQKVENTNLNVTLVGFLDQLAAEDNPVQGEVVEVEGTISEDEEAMFR